MSREKSQGGYISEVGILPFNIRTADGEHSQSYLDYPLITATLVKNTY